MSTTRLELIFHYFLTVLQLDIKNKENEVHNSVYIFTRYDRYGCLKQSADFVFRIHGCN